MNASLWTELQVWFALRGLRERAIVLIAVSGRPGLWLAVFG